MRITTQGVERLKSETNYLNRFKWEMGDSHSIIFPKVMLDPENKNKFGEMQPIDNMSASQAAREVLYRREVTANLESTLAGDELKKAVDVEVAKITDKELHEKYNRYTDLAAFARYTRKISIETPESIARNAADPKKSKLYERVVASKAYRDDEGIYHKDGLDKIASLVSVICKKREEKTRAKFEANPDLTSNQVDALVKDEKDKKPLKGMSLKIGMEILSFKYEAGVPKVSAGTVNTSNFLYIISKDHLDKITPFLYADTDVALDYLELKITHNVYNEGSPALSKAKSGMNVKIMAPSANATVANVHADFARDYAAYRKSNPMTEITVESKIPEFKSLNDNELFSIFKSWINLNLNLLSDEEVKKHEEVMEAINSSLDQSDIKNIIDQGANNAPNTIKGTTNAPGNIPGTPVEENTVEAQNTEIFAGMY